MHADFAVGRVEAQAIRARRWKGGAGHAGIGIGDSDCSWPTELLPIIRDRQGFSVINNSGAKCKYIGEEG